VVVSCSRGIWKNDGRSPNRANSIRIKPATTMPTSDQICEAGAPIRFVTTFSELAIT
jgi:hypothetical protein